MPVGATVVLCVVAGSVLNRIQAKEPWLRVYTGDDSIIELNSSTARFTPGNILRAEFRTIFSSPESIGGGQGAKYKTRLETIDFRLTDRRYRHFEISLVDSSGKTIQTKTADGSEEWRPIKRGGITERLYNAAGLLTPFGKWQVVAYRFAEEGTKEDKSPELKRLVGVRVDLRVDRAQVSDKVCPSPSFEDKDSTADALRQFGIDWKSISIKPEDARTINVRCDAGGWQPSQSLLVKENNKEEMLMLWRGVFLVLRRSD